VLEKYRIVLNRRMMIGMLWGVSYCTTNRIARECGDVGSRSTIYRYINQLEKLGLIYFYYDDNDRRVVMVSAKGRNFIDSFKEMF
jgi:predicted transcriptional regulator